MSGSSPRSDISQPASQDGMHRLTSKRGKWKMFVRATSPESTSRSSSKTGQETPENGETGNLCFHKLVPSPSLSLGNLITTEFYVPRAQ